MVLWGESKLRGKKGQRQTDAVGWEGEIADDNIGTEAVRQMRYTTERCVTRGEK